MAAYQYNPYPVNNRSNNNEQDQVAIFIDWDNLVISNYADRGSNRPDLEVLIRRAQQYGTVVIARAYAEWNVTADRLEVYKAGIEPIYAPVFHADRDLSGQTTRGKSLADPVMVTDCIDFLHLLPQIGTYVLVTGDKDMVPVVRLARLRGRRVVIIGPDYVANVLQQVSDEFIPYRYLLAQVVADPYAAYYQQTGQVPPQPYYPGQIPPQAGQPAPAQPAQSGTDRRNRRLTGNRRGQTSYTPPTPQPYARITPPPPAPQPAAPPLNPYAFYGQPGVAPVYPQPPQPELYQQPQPYGYPQTAAYQAVPAPQAPAVTPPAPAQPAPVFTAPAAQPGYPSAPVGRPGYSPAPVAPAPAAPPPPVPVPAASPVAEPAPADISGQGQNGKSGTGDFEEVKEVIQSILAQRVASGRHQMRARDLKEELLRRIPNFSERRYGFSKFKALLNAAETAGVLQIDQSGHILWVSAPGTPKMQFGVGLPGTEEAAQVADTDYEEETEAETEEEAAHPEAAELAARPDEAAVAASEAFDALQVAEPTAAPQEPTYTELVAGEAVETTLAEPAYEVIVPEERTTTLVGSSTHHAQPEAPVRAEVSRAESILGPRPAQLHQPFYQDVIVLIDHLRTRNRWLGYELLLSNVRDLLSREMPESEAKIQAGNILSRLLSDGIIKMAIEVHSRGARKMTVKVAHLQDENPSVRYALESYRIESEVPAPAEEVAAVEPDQAASVEGQTQLEEATLPEGSAADGQPQARRSTEEPADYGEGSASWGGYHTQQAHPAGDQSQGEAEGATEAPVAESAVELAVPAGGEVGELGQEAATVAPEQMPQDTTPEQPAELAVAQPAGQPEGAQSEGEQAQGELAAAQPVELTGHAVETPAVEEAGVAAETGEQSQGEPETAPQGEEGASAGDYGNAAEFSAEGAQGEAPQEYTPGQSFEENPPADNRSQSEGEGHPVEAVSEGGYFAADSDQSQGEPSRGEEGQPVQAESAFDDVPYYEGQPAGQPVGDQHQGEQSVEQLVAQPASQDGYEAPTQEPEQEGRQTPAEDLQPVVELDGDEADESEEGEEEAEGDSEAPKPARRPRRRRAPRPAPLAEGETSPGQGESMGQPAERRSRLGHHAHPHRRPHTR
jgi:uncharacterized LabA/DUF88 family protein